MKIIFCTRSLAVGGAERQMVVLAGGLASAGQDVAIISYYDDDALAGELSGSSVRLFNLKKQGRWDTFGFMVRYLSVLRKERPDIIYGFLPVPNLLSLLVRVVSPATRVVWGLRASDIDFSRYDWFVRFTFRLSAVLSRFADQIICNSVTGRTFHLQQGFCRRNLDVVFNGVDTDRFSISQEKREAQRRLWGVDDTDILIGIVGRLEIMKDHETFFRAFALAAGKDRRLKCVMAGNGDADYKNKIDKLIAELQIGHLIIRESDHQDMAALYNGLDLLVLSSITEGFPNVLLEAMACGLPCVSTDAGDVRTILENEDLICPAGDFSELADRIMFSIEKPASLSEKQALRDRVCSLFSVQVMVEKTRLILQKLCGELD
jgi:glycosyltransferase involved in cell wall biosynthesis